MKKNQCINTVEIFRKIRVSNHVESLPKFKTLKICKNLGLKVTENVCILVFKPDLNNNVASNPLNMLS